MINQMKYSSIKTTILYLSSESHTLLLHRKYVQAPGCNDLLPVCNEVEEMEKMEKIKANQEQYGAKKGASSNRGRAPAKQTFKRQSVPIT